MFIIYSESEADVINSELEVESSSELDSEEDSDYELISSSANSKTV